MKLYFLAVNCFIFGTLASFGAAQPPPAASDAPSPDLTPAQAVQIIKTSDDYAAIINAIKVAATDSTARQTAIDFFDVAKNDPARAQRIVGQLLLGVLRARSQDTLANVQAVMQSPQQFLNDHSGDDTSQFLVDAEFKVSDSLVRYLASCPNPGAFEVFKQFDRVTPLNLTNLYVAYYANYLSPGSPNEPLYLDYLVKSLGGDATPILLKLNSPAANAALSNLIASDEYWQKLSRGSIPNLLSVNSAPADARIDKIMASEAYWTSPGAHAAFDYGILPNRRYDPRIVRLMQMELMDPRQKNPAPVINGLLSPAFGSDSFGQPLDRADPSVYPQLLSFIAAAEKIVVSRGLPSRPAELAGTIRKILADSKQQILDLYASHHLPVPTVLPPIPPLPAPANTVAPTPPAVAPAKAP